MRCIWFQGTLSDTGPDSFVEIGEKSNCHNSRTFFEKKKKVQTENEEFIYIKIERMITRINLCTCAHVSGCVRICRWVYKLICVSIC